MKNIKTVTIMLIIILIISGCAGEAMVGSDTRQQNGYYNITYMQFTGEHDVSFTADYDGMCKVSVATMLGRLDVELFGEMDGQWRSLYYGEKMQTDTSIIMLDAGNYNLKIYGKKHSGGVTVEYPVDPAKNFGADQEDYFVGGAESWLR